MLKILLALSLLPTITLARNDGRFVQADPLIKKWIEGLKDKKGEGCCNTADGFPVSDTEWKIKNDKYWVYILDDWYEVPEDAVLDTPNRLGIAMVWWYPTFADGKKIPKIRCFMRGLEI